jgi:hypothetical protein
MHNTSYHSIGNSHSSIIANSRNNSHTRNTNHHSISNSSIDNNNLSNKDMSKKTNNNHIVEWVKANFSGGHLGNVNKLKNMSDLRFGVVIA